MVRVVLLVALLAGIFGATVFVATRFTSNGETGRDLAAARDATPPWTPTFDPEACPFTMPAGQTEGATVHCGTVDVLQEHDEPEGKRLKLAVAVFKATGAEARSDPLVYLQGGPGLATLGPATELFTADFARPIQQTRDIVFVDQRGTGQSVPLLRCDEVRSLERSQQTASPEEAKSAASACSARFLADGVRVGAFNTAESAKDIADVLVALGYRAWNIYGVSYGTRLALRLLHDHPENARSVVLDSAVPFDVFFQNGAYENLLRSLDELFASCAADAACHEAYPDPERSLAVVVERLQRQPITVTGEGPDGTKHQLRVDGSRLLGLIQQMLYFTSTIALVPALIAELETGRLETQALGSFAALIDSSQLSDGVYLTMECLESLPLAPTNVPVTTGVILPQSDSGTLSPADLQLARELCKAWGTPVPAALTATRVSAPVPVIVLEGQFDPVTPPAYGERIAREIKTAKTYFFKGSTHGVLSDTCSMQLVSSFLHDPAAPDRGCIDELRPAAFVVH